MLRNADIFQGQLGWKQPSLLPFPLDTENTTSRSGRYYDDFSGLVDAYIIYSNWSDFDKADDLATQELKFNQYLKDFGNQALNQLFNSVFRQVSDLKENKTLYPFEADFNHTLSNDGDFVGFEIDTVKDKGITTVLNSVDLTFDADGEVELLLFHSSKLEAVESETIAVTANDTITQTLDWALDRLGGKYYVGYSTETLTPQAYNRQFELGNVKASYSYVYMQEMKVPGYTGSQLFDVNDVSNTSYTYGLNFDISTFCDYTSVAQKNANKFNDAIGMQVAVNAMDLYLNNIRSNNDERMSASKVVLALDGNENPQLGLLTQGLRVRLQEEVMRLRDLFVEQDTISKVTIY